MSEGDRRLFAANLGRMIEQARPDDRMSLIHEAARNWKGANHTLVESVVNKRKDYVRFSDDPPRTRYKAKGSDFLGFAEALADALRQPREGKEAAERRVVRSMTDGSSFDRTLGAALTRDDAYAAFLRHLDEVRRVILNQVDLHGYFASLAEQNVYVCRSDLSRAGTFQWRPDTDTVAFADTEERDCGLEKAWPLVLGEQLYWRDQLRLHPGKVDQTGDLFAPVPHVHLGRLTVNDDVGYGDAAVPYRKEPTASLRYPLYLLLAPDGAEGYSLALLLDTTECEEVPSRADSFLPVPRGGLIDKSDTVTGYDLPSARNETYLLIDDGEEARRLLTALDPDFEPAFLIPDDTYTPLSKRSIGGMILANLVAAPEDERIDRQLLHDAKARAEAVKALLATAAEQFDEDMKRRINGLRDGARDER